ncbi:MAG: transglutaminase domain-containing protein [Clostridia bacterium]|nr:transglutaminase domain-containing protein [Clostridia bacterium]
MINQGLLIKPEFDNINKYLQSGEKTLITEKIKEISKNITGNTHGMLVKQILIWMHKNTTRLHNSGDNRKFKRTATEILESRERTGCCDSSTLFTALARSKYIPTMQIITLSKNWTKQLEKGEKIGTQGHYFVACYLKDITGKYDWIRIDSDRDVQDVRDVRLNRFNRENRNIDENYYAFAYVRDYSDVNFNGIKIDSIENMSKIQIAAYEQCNVKGLSYRDEIEI